MGMAIRKHAIEARRVCCVIVDSQRLRAVHSNWYKGNIEQENFLGAAPFKSRSIQSQNFVRR